MTEDSGKHESRTLDGGEMVHLTKAPGAKWKISGYECKHHVHSMGSINMFRYIDGLPPNWKTPEFESADAAVAFAQKEIKQGGVPSNQH